MRSGVPTDPRGAMVAAMQATAPSGAITAHDDARTAEIDERRANVATFPAAIISAVVPPAVIAAEVPALFDALTIHPLHIARRALHLLTRASLHPHFAVAAALRVACFTALAHLRPAHFAATATAPLGAPRFAAAARLAASGFTTTAAAASAFTASGPAALSAAGFRLSELESLSRRNGGGRQEGNAADQRRRERPGPGLEKATHVRTS